MIDDEPLPISALQHWAYCPRQCGLSLIHLEQAFDDNLHTLRGNAVHLAAMEELERRLLRTINLDTDCLRLYRLSDARGCEVREHGRFKATDFDAPLVA